MRLEGVVEEFERGVGESVADVSTDADTRWTQFDGVFVADAEPLAVPHNSPIWGRLLSATACMNAAATAVGAAADGLTATGCTLEPHPVTMATAIRVPSPPREMFVALCRVVSGICPSLKMNARESKPTRSS